MPTGRQIKASRVLLGWTQQDLAKAARVSPPTLTKIEYDRKVYVNPELVIKALEDAGIEFIENGVRLKR